MAALVPATGDPFPADRRAAGRAVAIEQLGTLLEHYHDMLSHYGSEAGMRVARKHVGWYSKGLADRASSALLSIGLPIRPR
jgi:tRNA-dihydrouridine synthase